MTTAVNTVLTDVWRQLLADPGKGPAGHRRKYRTFRMENRGTTLRESGAIGTRQTLSTPLLLGPDSALR
jgi:hypothetical protein